MAFIMTNGEKEILARNSEDIKITIKKSEVLCEKLEDTKNDFQPLMDELTKTQEKLERLSKERTDLLSEIVPKYII